MKLRYMSSHTFELGCCYVGKDRILWLLNRGHEKYANHMIRARKALHYADRAMEEAFSMSLPGVPEVRATAGCRTLIIMPKEEDEYYLPDIISYYQSSLPAEHTAWIISRLMNLCCFLRFNNLVHNGISADNCFISPNRHTLSLYGGWWYTVPAGGKLTGTKKHIFELMPLPEKTAKTAGFTTDIESVRDLGRFLTGSSFGGVDPLAEWLGRGSSDDAFLEFEQWNEAIIKRWGGRSFTPMEVKEGELYYGNR